MCHLPIFAFKVDVAITIIRRGISQEQIQCGEKVGILDVVINASAKPCALGMAKGPCYKNLLRGKLWSACVNGFHVFFEDSVESLLNWAHKYRERGNKGTAYGRTKG